MGIRTELIFGAELKKDTPENIIKTLKYMMGDLREKPEDFPLPNDRCVQLFQSSSESFGVNESLSKIWRSEISNQWHISTRSNIKNQHSEIEVFLKWIKPFIATGSGLRDFYAIVINENTEVPKIYYLSDE